MPGLLRRGIGSSRPAQCGKSAPLSPWMAVRDAGFAQRNGAARAPPGETALPSRPATARWRAVGAGWDTPPRTPLPADSRHTTMTNARPPRPTIACELWKHFLGDTSLVGFNEFKAITRAQLRRIPRRFRAGIHVWRVERRAQRQPGSLTGLYILGTYQADLAHLGPAITLYYGSFGKVFGRSDRRNLRRQIARTLAHELLHHWEMQAGRDELGDEDRRKLALWRQRLGQAGAAVTGRSLIEAIAFLYVLLLSLALVAAILE